MSTHFDRELYYSRQTVMAEIGPNGQSRLRDSKVAVVGLGGLGSVSSLYLALAGVGKLTLIDQDTVELTNLHRQALYSLKDLRHPKVEVAADRLISLNPEVEIEAIAENINDENVDSILENSDCIVDGLDNMRTRYLLNRHCVKRHIPFIFGGAIGMEGNVAIFKTPETPCLECILPGINDGGLPTCDTRGVIGATTGIIGSLQALETIKLLAGTRQKLESKLMIFDFTESEFRTVDLYIRQDCPVCQLKHAPEAAEHRIAWLCGSNTINVNPAKPTSVNLNAARQVLQGEHRILLATPMVLVFDYKGHEVSIFKRGRMLIKNVSVEADAIQIYREIDEMIRN
jgi:molybdopterin/thiamine biosynthesis adenylyltransferase